MGARRFCRNAEAAFVDPQATTFTLLADSGVGSGAALTGVTFTRASGGTCWTAADGSTLVTLLANQPRVEPAGLLIEGAGTNWIYGSELFSAGGWGNFGANVITANAAVAPDGTTTMDRISNEGVSNNTSVYQAVTGFTPSIPTSAAFSLWVAAPSGTSDVTLSFYNVTAAAPTMTAYRSDGGLVTTASVGGGTFRAYANVGTTPVRITLALSGLVTDTTLSVAITPGIRDTSEDTVDVWGGQLEIQQIFSTSYINSPTSTPATRAADVASIAGTAISNTKGAMTCTFRPLGIVASGSQKIVGTTGASAHLAALTASTSLTVFDGTNTGTATISAAARRNLSVRAAWVTETLAMSIADGATVQSATYDGGLGGGSTVYIGSEGGSSNFAFGNIKTLKFYASNLGGA